MPLAKFLQEQGTLTIDLTSMPDLHDLNETGGIVDAVDDAIVTLPNPIAF